MVDTLQFPNLGLSHGIHNRIFGKIVYHLYPEHIDPKKNYYLAKLMNQLRDLSGSIKNGFEKLSYDNRSLALDLIE